jgi:hypothetical protein
MIVTPAPKPSSFNFRSYVNWVPLLGALFFMATVVVSSVYLAVLQPQELRQQAAEGTGDVELVLVPSTSPLRANTLSTIFVRVNTKGESIDGVQVVFDLKVPDTEGVTIKVKEGNGLRRIWDKVEGIDGGKRVSFAVITSEPNKPFSSNAPVDIAEVIFTAKQTGKVILDFDEAVTKANKHKETRNVLKQYFIQEYEVAAAPTPAPTPKPTAKPANTSTVTTVPATQSASKGTNQLPPKVTVTVTSDTGVGGTDTTSASTNVCNNACTYSEECGSGYVCYQQKCRLLGNVVSESCQPKAGTSSTATASATTPTVASCNAACTQSSQCSGALICYQGNCRDSANPESSTCSAGNLTDKQKITELCDSDCETNSECGDVLSCYRGKCRLASNPTGEKCTADSTSKASPSPSSDTTVTASPLPGSTNSTSSSSNVFASVIRVILVLGMLIGLGVAGIMGYLWFKDRQTSGL